MEKTVALDFIQAAIDFIAGGHKAMHGGRNIWKLTRAEALHSNCLPASYCLAHHPELLELYPKAKLVIGFVAGIDVPKSEIKQHKQNLIDFMVRVRFTNKDNVPEYHAWVTLDGTTLFDITGPIYLEGFKQKDDQYYLDNNPVNDRFDFVPVLEGIDAVSFYNKIAEAELAPHGWFFASTIVNPVSFDKRDINNYELSRKSNHSCDWLSRNILRKPPIQALKLTDTALTLEFENGEMLSCPYLTIRSMAISNSLRNGLCLVLDRSGDQIRLPRLGLFQKKDLVKFLRYLSLRVGVTINGFNDI
ncbi:hypothetical protein RJ45_02775 [Photobacterium gaetbulicola]|uniref:Uncharacterized protein n=1 Tax=Photobacterium gaetbulicola TaxID=1295392 RepID=A0A0B9H8C6_9GAMM|nr:hypothetical protein [Photobacterium gaetbulicola]KHT65162.1 hypothetical protein RJ45_02775 [Photobacterium gaetbulicola]